MFFTSPVLDKRSWLILNLVFERVRLNEATGLSNLCRLNDISVPGRKIAVENILFDRVVEKSRFLHNKAHACP